MGRWLGSSDDGGRSQSCCPAGRPRALTPALFAGPQASSHHHVTQAGRLALRDKLGCSVEGCCVHIHSAPAQLPGLTGSTSSLRPQESQTSNADTWSSPDAGPGGLPHGGERWEGWELGMKRKGALQMPAQVDCPMAEGDGRDGSYGCRDREGEIGRPPRYSPTGRYAHKIQSHGKSSHFLSMWCMSGSLLPALCVSPH